MNHNFGAVFLLVLVTIAIVLCGALACLVGLFVALPLTFIISMYAYEDLFGTVEMPAQTPPASNG